MFLHHTAALTGFILQLYAGSILGGDGSTKSVTNVDAFRSPSDPHELNDFKISAVRVNPDVLSESLLQEGMGFFQGAGTVEYCWKFGALYDDGKATLPTFGG